MTMTNQPFNEISNIPPVTDYIKHSPLHTNNIQAAVRALQMSDREVFFYCDRDELCYHGLHNVTISDMQRKTCVQITRESFDASKKEFEVLRKTGDIQKSRAYNYAMENLDHGFAWLNFYSYVSRNFDALCWCHEHEVERYVYSNPNLTIKTFTLMDRTIEYVQDGDRLFVKSYLNTSNPSPFFLRIQIGRYIASRTDFPEMFKECHEDVNALYVNVSIRPSAHALNVSINITNTHGNVVGVLFYVVTFPDTGNNIYFNFDLIKPKSILTEMNALYLSQANAKGASLNGAN